MTERNNQDNKEPKVKSIMGRAKIEEMVEKSEDINNLERLPEGCISDILSLTSPADVCRSSLLSNLIKSVADSDVIWEKFLPAGYQDIISRAFYPFPSPSPPKKELYYRLCNDPLLIDGGLKSFQLEKSSGKKCIMIGAKELAIDWGDDPNHWYWRGYPGSRFAEVAELKWTCWLDIRGKLETRLLSPKTFYAAYLVLKFKKDVYGFEGEPIKAKVEVVGRAGGDTSQERLIYLSTFNCGTDQYFARKRGDGWMEVEMGHFYNGEFEGQEVHVSVIETENLEARYGIIVQGMEFRPRAGA